MKVWVFSIAGLLAPSVSQASGDAGLVWEAVTGFATYAAVCGVLVVLLVKGRIAAWRLGGFLVSAAIAWWWFGDLRPPFRFAEFAVLLFVPLCFLLGIKRRSE
jgi:hypothetical protein